MTAPAGGPGGKAAGAGPGSTGSGSAGTGSTGPGGTGSGSTGAGKSGTGNATPASTGAASGGRPVKRSLTLRGHRTSVSLEDAFWSAFRDIAAARGETLNGLAARIDAERGEVGLASAIRVFVLRNLRD